YIQQSDWEIWYNPKMELDHQIPKNRLEKDYLISLIRGIGYSRYVTRMIGVKPIMKPILTGAYMVNDLRKILLHLLKYGADIRTDLVPRVELELLTSSLFSPLYLWKNGYLNKKQS
ncbi:MAG: hormogonium polysaccharide biosynthesis glycosyltransferase HpsE, partial [Planktothrix sp.]